MTEMTRDQAVFVLERGLDRLVQAVFVERMRLEDVNEAAGLGRTHRPGGSSSATQMLGRDEDTLLEQLRENAVEYALRQYVRQAGERLHAIGGLSLMRDVAERVANVPLSCRPGMSGEESYDRKMGFIDAAWAGVGTWQN